MAVQNCKMKVCLRKEGPSCRHTIGVQRRHRAEEGKKRTSLTASTREVGDHNLNRCSPSFDWQRASLP